MKETVPILDSVPRSNCTIEEKTTIPIVLPHTGTPVTSDLTWLRLVVKRQEQKCKLRVSFTSGAGPLAAPSLCFQGRISVAAEVLERARKT